MIARLHCFLRGHLAGIRETRDGLRWLVCPRCGHAERTLYRHEPVTIVPPAHERLTATKIDTQGGRFMLIVESNFGIIEKDAGRFVVVKDIS
jgi:hypothetical protein